MVDSVLDLDKFRSFLTSSSYWSVCLTTFPLYLGKTLFVFFNGDVLQIFLLLADNFKLESETKLQLDYFLLLMAFGTSTFFNLLLLEFKSLVSLRLRALIIVWGAGTGLY